MDNERKKILLRRTSIASSLYDSLEELKKSNELSEEDSTRILELFDQVFEKELKEVEEEFSLKGTIQHYQCLESTWSVFLEKVLLKRKDGDRHEERVEGLQIAAFSQQKEK